MDALTRLESAQKETANTLDTIKLDAQAQAFKLEAQTLQLEWCPAWRSAMRSMPDAGPASRC